jgi:DNA-binding Xre family transcriptional regulator
MKEIINFVKTHRDITEKQLSDELGVSRTTLHRWRKNPPHAIKVVSELVNQYVKIRLQGK